MMTDFVSAPQDSFNSISSAIAEKNIFKLKGAIPTLSDSQRLIILQQLSMLYKDKDYLHKNSSNARVIDRLINSLADSMSDEFLLKVFGC